MVRHHNKKESQAQASLFDDEEISYADDFVVNVPDSSADEKKAEPDTTISNIEINNIEIPKSLRYISFGSGSSGNSSYIGTEEGGILIDAGVELPKVFDVLKHNGVTPEMVKGICITHDHGDHIRFAYTYMRKYRHIHVYCTNRVINGILRRHNISRRIKDQHVAIYKEIPFELAGLKITAFNVSHDGSDNAGFFIEYGDIKFCIATDLGYISTRAEYYLSQANFMMLESNYDRQMLDNGKYPEYLKARIKSETGHLDNKVAANFIREKYNPDLKYIFLCHLSNDNNTPEIAKSEFVNELAKIGVSVGNGGTEPDDNKKDIQIIALPRLVASPWFVLRK